MHLRVGMRRRIPTPTAWLLLLLAYATHISAALTRDDERWPQWSAATPPEGADHTDSSAAPNQILLQIGTLQVDEPMQQAHLRPTSQHAPESSSHPMSAAEDDQSHLVTLRGSGLRINLRFPSATLPRFHLETLDPSVLSSEPPQQWLLHLKAPITSQLLSEIHAVLAPYRLGNYVPRNSYLLSAPKSIVLRLKQQPPSAAASSLAGRILLLVEFPAEAKLQRDLRSTAVAHQEERIRHMSEQWQSHLAASADLNQRAKLAGQLTSQVGKISVELHIHLMYPTMPVHTDTEPATQDAFPTHRRDTRFISSHLASLRALLDPTGLVSVEIVNSKEFVVRIPREVLPSAEGASGDPSTSQAQLDTESGFAARFATWTTGLVGASPFVHYIESHLGPLIRPLNKYARFAVQSNMPFGTTAEEQQSGLDVYQINSAASLHPNSTFPSASLSSALGLHGENQVIAVADSGVDYDSCFFHDPSESVPVNAINLRHRKIIGYMTPSLVVNGQIQPAPPGDASGHGTHVAGSIAGAAIQPTDQPGAATPAELQQLQEFDGMAPAAKLMVFDFGQETAINGSADDGVSTDTLDLPLDLYHDYLEPSLLLGGASIASNSFGTENFTPSGFGEKGATVIGGVYDSYALSVDQFLYDHPEYSFVVAAGNSGSLGSGSIATPGISKNALTVGSARSAGEAFFAYGKGEVNGIRGPPEFAAWINQTAEEGGSTMPVTLAPPPPATTGATAAAGAGSFTSAIFASTPLTTTVLCLADPVDACQPLANTGACIGGIIFADAGGSSCTLLQQAAAMQAFGAAMIVFVSPTEESVVFPVPEASAHVLTIPVASVPASLGRLVRSYLGQFATNVSQSAFTFPVAFLPSATASFASYSTSQLSSFSSHGPTSDGRIKPDVTAPGEWIASARSTGKLDDFQCGNPTPLASASNNPFPRTLAFKQGTSMSTPIAAGALALVRQYFMDGWYVDPITRQRRIDFAAHPPSSALLKAVMIAGAQPLVGPIRMVDQSDPFASVASFPLPFSSSSFLGGFGRIQLDSVLSFPGSRVGETGLWVEDAMKVEQGQTIQFCFRIPPIDAASARQPFKVTLVWTDPPAALASAIALVNNLDLVVLQTPDDAVAGAPPKVFIGNAPAADDGAPAASSPLAWDALNNVEQVTLPPGVARPGTYSVLVRGTSITVDSPQRFALVVTGGFEAGRNVTNDGGASAGGSKAACHQDVFCPNACSGNGVCTTEPLVHDPAISAPSLGANLGVCICSGTFVGADCGTLASSLAASSVLPFLLPSQAWYYASVAFHPLTDSAVTIVLELLLTGDHPTTSDPDLYVLMPNSTAAGKPQTNFPTRVRSDVSDVSVAPVVEGSSAFHRLTIPSGVLSVSPAGPIMIGVYGSGLGVANCRLSVEITEIPPTDSTGPSSKSSTGGDETAESTGTSLTLSSTSGTEGDDASSSSSGGSSSSSTSSVQSSGSSTAGESSSSSTGPSSVTSTSSITSIPRNGSSSSSSSSTAPSSFSSSTVHGGTVLLHHVNRTYSCWSFQLRLLLSYSSISSDLAAFRTTFRHQLQTGLGLTTWTYLDSDPAFQLNRILVTTATDSTLTTDGSGKAAVERARPKGRQLDTIGVAATTVSFVFLPSINELPAGLSFTSSTVQSSTGSRSLSMIDLLPSGALAARLNVHLRANASDGEILGPSASFVKGGALLATIDRHSTPVQQKIPFSICSVDFSPTATDTAVYWSQLPCGSVFASSTGSGNFGGPQPAAGASSTPLTKRTSFIIAVAACAGGVLLLAMVLVCLHRRRRQSADSKKKLRQLHSGPPEPEFAAIDLAEEVEGGHHREEHAADAVELHGVRHKEDTGYAPGVVSASSESAADSARDESADVVAELHFEDAPGGPLEDHEYADDPLDQYQGSHDIDDSVLTMTTMMGDERDNIDSVMTSRAMAMADEMEPASPQVDMDDEDQQEEAVHSGEEIPGHSPLAESEAASFSLPALPPFIPPPPTDSRSSAASPLRNRLVREDQPTDFARLTTEKHIGVAEERYEHIAFAQLQAEPVLARYDPVAAALPPQPVLTPSQRRSPPQSARLAAGILYQPQVQKRALLQSIRVRTSTSSEVSMVAPPSRAVSGEATSPPHTPDHEVGSATSPRVSPSPSSSRYGAQRLLSPQSSKSGSPTHLTPRDALRTHDAILAYTPKTAFVLSNSAAPADPTATQQLVESFQKAPPSDAHLLITASRRGSISPPRDGVVDLINPRKKRTFVVTTAVATTATSASAPHAAPASSR